MTDPVGIVSLVYRSPRYADAVWSSLHRHTPHLSDGRARFLFCANDATDAVLDHLQDRGYPFVEYHHATPWPTEDELYARGIGPPDYIHRSYAAYNTAIKAVGAERVVVLSTDMMFSPGWLEAMLEHDDGQTSVISQLTERNHPKFGVIPGALCRDFGSHPDNFDEERWLDFAATRSRSGLRDGGAYQPQLLHRSWLELVGYFHEGNVAGPTPGTVAQYGDAELIERLASIGVRHATALGSMVYHFKEGEREES